MNDAYFIKHADDDLYVTGADKAPSAPLRSDKAARGGLFKPRWGTYRHMAWVFYGETGLRVARLWRDERLDPGFGPYKIIRVQKAQREEPRWAHISTLLNNRQS